MSAEKTMLHTVSDRQGTARPPTAFIIVLNAQAPALMGRMFKVDRPEVILGNSPDAHVQLEEDGVSRRHAKIVRSGDGYSLVDLGAPKGTFLNADRVSSTRLEDGDRIQVGPHTVLKFALHPELEEHYARSLYEQATRDALTHVFHYAYFLDVLRKEFSYAVRHRVPLSLLLADVDQFDRVNETFGRPAGDQLLTLLARRLTETLRTEDVLARKENDCFAVLLREVDAAQAYRCAERCRTAVHWPGFRFRGTALHVTLSLGVCTLRDGSPLDPGLFIHTASQQLAVAKAQGGNRTAVHT